MPFHRISDPGRLHALIDAIMLIEVEADLDVLLETIVETARGLVGSRYGALGVIGPDGAHLSRFLTAGIEPSVRRAIGPSPHGHGVLGAVIDQAAPVRAEHLHEHPAFEGFPEHHPDMTTFLGVPVLSGDGQIFGNLYLTDRLDGQPFDDEDEAIVEAFGRAAGLVIDQATLRAHLRDLTLSEERERLARDLHDTVIQRLFGVGLALQMALSAEIDDPARVRINQALDDLDATIHEIRTTIFEIDQDDFEGLRVSARVGALIEEARERLGLEVYLHLAPEVDGAVSPRCAHHLASALREALANVARHAQAHGVDVTITLDGPLVRLAVRDDGVGFRVRVGPGRGLKNLTSRAHELGGDCVVESAPGHGTLVQWTAKRD